ncbi:MAG TPA: SDR family oxidoreductase [Brevundimonas sp.]|uniref:SDR family oxidoreductase n=1 Tax=Brevundimonas sp. TaxID=1871086 RepID=UPI002DF3551F|nr:SDR family oxidoreductase [Brevundimonas sp.]
MTEPARGVALVTGAARRIGREIALRAARAGWDVAVHHGSSVEEAEAVAADVRNLGRRAAVLQADLTDVAAAHALIGRAAEALGPVSLLVNNASVFQEDRLETVTGDSWSTHMDVNLRAPVLLAQAFAAQAPDGAAIVNLLDQRVLKPDPRFFSYALSRAGLHWATTTMAQALAPRIRVNAVAPGPTLQSTHQSAAEFEAEWSNVPLEKAVDPRAVADAVIWLAVAVHVTGQTIAVDSGQRLAWRTPDVQD